MNFLGMGRPKMVITEPASPALAAEQRWISHHRQCSVCSQPVRRFFYSFFIYWVNLARAEVLSWQNWLVKSSIDIGQRAVLVAQCGACSPWPGSPGPPPSFCTPLSFSPRPKGVSRIADAVGLKETTGIQTPSQIWWLLGDASGHPDFTQPASVMYLPPKVPLLTTTITHF